MGEAGKGNANQKGKNLIVNLSDVVLTTVEADLLSKGLKFCPTQRRTDVGEMRKDLDSFHNKLRTKQFFERENLKDNTKKCDQAQASHSTNQPRVPFSTTLWYL